MEEESNTYKENCAVACAAASPAERCRAPGGLREAVGSPQQTAALGPPDQSSPSKERKSYTERKIIHISLKASSLKY